MASMGGRVGFAFSSRSCAFDAGRESSWDEWEAEERVVESGLCCWVRREESFEGGRAKDCSKGLGSRSKLLRLGFGGGRCWWAAWCSRWAGGGEGSCLFGMTLSLVWGWCGLLARAGEVMTSVSLEEAVRERMTTRAELREVTNSPLILMTNADVVMYTRTSAESKPSSEKDPCHPSPPGSPSRNNVMVE